MRALVIGNNSRVAACLEAESGPVNVSWNFSATAASGVNDPLAGLCVHLLRRMRFTYFSGLGSRWMDLAANLSLRLGTNTESSRRDTRQSGVDAISDSSNGSFRDAIKICNEAAATVSDPIAAVVT
jgi:hypothetical protein